MCLHPFMIIYMNKSFNYGIYADLIKQYIAYKRSLGFKMDDIEKSIPPTLTIIASAIMYGLGSIPNMIEATIVRGTSTITARILFRMAEINNESPHSTKSILKGFPRLI